MSRRCVVKPFKTVLQHVFVCWLQRPGKLAKGRGGWAIQAKLQMYLWLGLRDNKRKVKEYMQGLPEGYERTSAVRNADQIPPDILVYKGGRMNNNIIMHMSGLST